MQIKSDNPLQLQVAESAQTELQVELRKFAPAQKLKADQPAIHSGGLMADSPIGAEFRAQNFASEAFTK